MMMMSIRSLAYRINPFWLELSYFIVLSLVGFLALKVSKPRTTTISSSFKPKDIDVFFTSVSSATVSSMSTVEMEVFSNIQLIFITFLMFLGGECFTSWLGLHFFKSKLSMKDTSNSRSSSVDHVELGLVTTNNTKKSKLEDNGEKPNNNNVEIEIVESIGGDKDMKLESCLRVLARIVLSYILVVQILGSTLVTMYVGLVPSVRRVLKQKGINLRTFAVFTTVSTFANCGFVPTNENMMVFKRNSGLLLILIPQILLGNTLFPVCLRLTIWCLEKTTKRSELKHMLSANNGNKWLGYSHFLPSLRCKFLAITVLGLILLQFIVLAPLEWHSEATKGLSNYEKFVGCLFEVVNSRHTGESVFDLSVLSPAILVLFVIMMYLPPYTTFLPIKDEKNNLEIEGNSGRKLNDIKNFLFSPLGNLVVFTVLICITEREKMKNDPLNFNVLNIVIEVVSAYGNVGFSIGYSCERQIKADGFCEDKSFGFAGRWTNAGKFILIIVMFFGRLKKYHLKTGRAWKLS